VQQSTINLKIKIGETTTTTEPELKAANEKQGLGQ
jgi:hypothetical protein